MIEEVAQESIKVFISYSWDSPQHKDKVLSLANQLRDPGGVEAYLDQYVKAIYPYTPEETWDRWMENQIRWADFVLLVCSETYKRRFEGNEEPDNGMGVTWEGTIIRREIYDNQVRNTRFIPVVFSQNDRIYVPDILRGETIYVLEEQESSRELLYRLRNQPVVEMPDVARTRLPAPRRPTSSTPFLSFPVADLSTEPPPVRLDDQLPPEFIPLGETEVDPHPNNSSSVSRQGRGRREKYRLIGGACAIFLAVVAVVVWIWQELNDPPVPPEVTSVAPASSSLRNRISAGEKALILQEVIGDQNPAFEAVKQRGMQAIADQNYEEAVIFLENALRLYRNAPETLIYLNNARIGSGNAHTIAVTAPIGSNVDDAMSVLRGVAQAQNEINQRGGINGVPLRVLISLPFLIQLIQSMFFGNPCVRYDCGGRGCP